MADLVNELIEIEIDKIRTKHGRNLSFHGQVCLLWTLEIVLYQLAKKNIYWFSHKSLVFTTRT